MAFINPSPLSIAPPPLVAVPPPALRPDRADELLQGFLGIDGSQNVVNARLTQAELTAYGQRQFFAPDPNAPVFGYLNSNFANISKLDGDATSISANDLVQLKQGLPTAPTTPPVLPPPVYGGQQQMFSLFSQMMQIMLTLLSSLTQR